MDKKEQVGMLKRISLFISAFLTFLLIAYLSPILNTTRTKETTNSSYQDQTHEMYDSKNFPIMGGAKYINMKSFPKASWVKDLTSVIQDEKGNIVQFTVTQKNGPLQPFQLGKTLSELAENIVFQNKFTYKIEQTKYTVELDDLQLNYSPLIKFGDDVFAILHINHETGKLEAVTYLYKTRLQAQGLYFIN
jgi:hypothetical protein